MNKQLATHRKVLLDLYTSLHQTLDKGAKSIDAGLRAAQRNIAAEKFLLAIVGEVKAGKSTFINALLGEAILPYDALQATSEIVEIDKSDKRKYASPLPMAQNKSLRTTRKRLKMRRCRFSRKLLLSRRNTATFPSSKSIDS